MDLKCEMCGRDMLNVDCRKRYCDECASIIRSVHQKIKYTEKKSQKSRMSYKVTQARFEACGKRAVELGMTYGQYMASKYYNIDVEGGYYDRFI